MAEKGSKTPQPKSRFQHVRFSHLSLSLPDRREENEDGERTCLSSLTSRAVNDGCNLMN